MITTTPAVGAVLVLAAVSSALSGCLWRERHDRDVQVEPRRDREPDREHREEHPEHHDDDHNK
jgi:hypothetical protein